MTDQSNSQNAANPQQPPTTVVSASDLVAQAIARIPALAEVRPQLELVFGVYVMEVAGQVEFVKETALEDLAAFFETDEEGLRAAILEINRVIAAESVSIVDVFRELTGAELDTRTLDIQGRVQEELDQQRQQERLAREWLAKVQAIIAKLGIRDLYTEKKQKAPQQPAKPQKGDILTRLQSLAIQNGWMTVEAEAELPEVEEHEVDADWLTPPILSLDNPNYVRLTTKIKAVERMVARFGGDKESTLAALANMNMPADELEAVVEEFSQMIHDELEQVQDITSDVGQDTQTITDRIDAVRDVKQVYQAVLQAFFPNPATK